jgi:hypothetical protein
LVTGWSCSERFGSRAGRAEWSSRAKPRSTSPPGAGSWRAIRSSCRGRRGYARPDSSPTPSHSHHGKDGSSRKRRCVGAPGNRFPRIAIARCTPRSLLRWTRSGSGIAGAQARLAISAQRTMEPRDRGSGFRVQKAVQSGRSSRPVRTCGRSGGSRTQWAHEPRWVVRDAACTGRSPLSRSRLPPWRRPAGGASPCRSNAGTRQSDRPRRGRPGMPGPRRACSRPGARHRASPAVPIESPTT